MKLALTITEEFGDTAAVIDFAHRLKIMLAMPQDLFMKLAAGLAGAAVMNERNSHRTEAARPAPAESAAEYPAAATQSVFTEKTNGVVTTNVGGTGPATATPTADSPTPPADVAPSDTRPRGKRGRPSAAEVAARTAAEAPKANTGGASGVVADVVTQPAKTHPLQEAISAGEAEAQSSRDFSDKCLSYAQKDVAGYKAILKEYGVNSARQIPAEKRAEFLEKCEVHIDGLAAY